MAWNFSNDKPIFQQLVDRITIDIISGKYKSSEKLEPVRDLAVIAGVNPNTMQRALAAIEEKGIIFTKRGDGRYVSEDEESMKRTRQEYVDKSLTELIGSLKALGLSDEEIVNSVEVALSSQKQN